MKIETRFNRGDDVVFIHDDKLKRLPVKDVEFVGDKIRYTFVTYEHSGIGMGSDEVSTTYEEDCFGSAAELAEFYENKWKNDKK